MRIQLKNGNIFKLENERSSILALRDWMIHFGIRSFEFEEAYQNHINNYDPYWHYQFQGFNPIQSEYRIEQSIILGYLIKYTILYPDIERKILINPGDTVLWTGRDFVVLGDFYIEKQTLVLQNE